MSEDKRVIIYGLDKKQRDEKELKEFYKKIGQEYLKAKKEGKDVKFLHEPSNEIKFHSILEELFPKDEFKIDKIKNEITDVGSAFYKAFI